MSTAASPHASGKCFGREPSFVFTELTPCCDRVCLAGCRAAAEASGDLWGGQLHACGGCLASRQPIAIFECSKLILVLTCCYPVLQLQEALRAEVAAITAQAQRYRTAAHRMKVLYQAASL